MSHKFVKVGDVVKLKAGTKLWDKLSYDGRYMVMKIEPNPGYTDNTCFITKLEDGRSNIINLKINERYFEVVWEDKAHTLQTKFSVGDKVISIKNTPEVPEGFVGYIVEDPLVDVVGRWDYAVRKENHALQTEYFTEDELELLNAAKQDFKDLKIPHDSIGLSFDDPKMNVTPADIKGITRPIKSDGGSSSYYDLPVPEWLLSELFDREIATEGKPYIKTEEIIAAFFGNDFDYANIIKCLVRVKGLQDKTGGKAGNSVDYECNKMKYSVEKIRGKR